MNEDLQREWGVQIAIRTGINSGDVVAGDASSGQSLVTGDAVNVAARLQQAAAPGETLIGDATRRLVAGTVEVEPLPPLAVRGKSEPLDRLAPGRDAPASRVAWRAAPLQGRDAELRALRETFERVAYERAPSAWSCWARPASASPGWPRELHGALRDRATVLDRALPALRRGHHLLAAR